MRSSHLFTKTERQAPHDADTANARLLIQGGFVDPLMAGVYSYLPLGLRVLRRIEAIVREEMNKLGGQEVLMPTLHPKDPWVKTGGWDSIDVLFKIKSRTGNEYALGQSEEEIVTPLVLSRAKSYKQFPLAVYQIHWKYRDELRAKSGIMRGREFFMKDMYSFHTSQEDFDRFYQQAKEVYLRLFSRFGLTAKVTEASGGAFSKKVSYEFMVLTDAGEDDILYCERCDFCVNKEIATVKEGDACPRKQDGALKSARASEVGNVFDLGTKYGQDFDLPFIDADGNKQFPIMGCYGIGISRVMGVIVEKFNDEKGIIWPKSVSPFAVTLVSLSNKDPEVQRQVSERAAELYEEWTKQGIEVFWDDRDASPGEKFSSADLLGFPLRLVLSGRTMADGMIEWKGRTEAESRLVPLADITEKLMMFVNE
ncbi:hypothetical protein HYV73_00200 [Candidatus Uhrbacteria bacterium]|nr:hypothetical protein [Candidatus Uhrbacteria bacterium]